MPKRSTPSPIPCLIIIAVALAALLISALRSTDTTTESQPAKSGSIPLGNGQIAKPGEIQGSSVGQGGAYSPQQAMTVRPGELDSVGPITVR